MKNQIACNYTVLRFRPYPETGEFVNLGVAMACPDLHWFAYRLETRRQDRITGFFPELKHTKDAFIEGRKLFKDELERIRMMLTCHNDDAQFRFKDNAKLFNQAFLNLVRYREEVFCFSPPRVCLTDDPKAALDKLFDHYVERGFAQKQEYQESLMTKRLRNVFSAEKILQYYEVCTFGDDLCHVRFPLVRKSEARFTRAIQPLDLDKEETPRIVEHADHWKNKLTRLWNVPEHPEHVLLVVRQPHGGKRLDVCRQMWKELEDAGAVLLPKEDRSGIIDFAQKI